MGRLSDLEFLTGRGGAVSSTSDRASRDFDSVSCVIEKKKKKKKKKKKGGKRKMESNEFNDLLPSFFFFCSCTSQSY